MNAKTVGTRTTRKGHMMTLTQQRPGPSQGDSRTERSVIATGAMTYLVGCPSSLTIVVVLGETPI